MKPDSNIQASQKKDIKMPFVSPLSANRNFHRRCPEIKKVGQVQNLNRRGEMASLQKATIVSLAQESHVTDFCNGNFPPEGSSSEGLHGWTVENPYEKHNGRNKPWSRSGQEIPPCKTTPNVSKDILNKDIFLFWAKKADDTNNKISSCVSDSKKVIERHQKVTDFHVHPSNVGLKCMKGRHCPPTSNGHETTQRKTWRDLFPDPEVFNLLDTHVLRVSEQLKLKPGPMSIQTVVALITEEARSPLEKARAIWVWLCHNIEYDVDGFLGLSEKIHSPEQVLLTRKGVCSGYAHLYREMCKEAGLSCVGVSGHGRGAGYSQGQSFLQKKSNHMWNAVKLEDQWFLLDACWGAGLVDVEKGLFVPKHDDFFFLTDPEDFIQSHWPDEPQWQLIQPPVTLEIFEDRVYKTPEFFKLQLTLRSPDTSVLQTGKTGKRRLLGSR
ncbi:kyphoscoliosis peptidase [Anolis carolinensis]|uniref:kyphoscoliosis peptidase n=1 Tax=Anolis carolinensis TaxID=28377 RepID=UPI002F2B3BA8